MAGIVSAIIMGALFMGQLGGTLLDIPSIGNEQLVFVKSLTGFLMFLNVFCWMNVES